MYCNCPSLAGISRHSLQGASYPSHRHRAVVSLQMTLFIKGLTGTPTQPRVHPPPPTPPSTQGRREGGGRSPWVTNVVPHSPPVSHKAEVARVQCSPSRRHTNFPSASQCKTCLGPHWQTPGSEGFKEDTTRDRHNVVS